MNSFALIDFIWIKNKRLQAIINVEVYKWLKSKVEWLKWICSNLDKVK